MVSRFDLVGASVVALALAFIMASCADNRRRSSRDGDGTNGSGSDVTLPDGFSADIDLDALLSELPGIDGTDGTDATDGTDGTVGTDGGGSYTIIEIQDDPNNSTLDPCDAGPVRSPGADIESAQLIDSQESIKGNLINCALVSGGGCPNDNDDPAGAEGLPEASMGEGVGYYTSLNGGILRCEWEGGAEAEEGDVIEIIEIGGSGGVQVEQYRVRLCTSVEGDCTPESFYSSGTSVFPVEVFFNQ